MSRDIFTRWVNLGQLANRVHNATFFSRAQVLWSYDLLPQPQRQFALTVNCLCSIARDDLDPAQRAYSSTAALTSPLCRTTTYSTAFHRYSLVLLYFVFCPVSSFLGVRLSRLARFGISRGSGCQSGLCSAEHFLVKRSNRVGCFI